MAADLEAARKNAATAATSLTLADERARTAKLAFEEAVRGRDAVMSGFPDGITTVPKGNEICLDTEAGFTRAVDLGKVLLRQQNTR